MVLAYSVGYVLPILEYMGIANMAEIPARKSRAKASSKTKSASAYASSLE